MVIHWRSAMGILVGMFALVLMCGYPGSVSAADEGKQTKKPTSTQGDKAPKVKAPTKKFETAESAGKTKACFGEAPKIEKISPDEGKAGDKVTITGTKFGSPDCLRTVSFGPGHSAAFTMQNATTITATVPAGGRKGLALLTVTTASGEDSKSFLVK